MTGQPAHARTEPPPGHYREDLRRLDTAATPGPWRAVGEFYGVGEGVAFEALGFAPHHALDPVLIAAYRTHLHTVLSAMDAVDHHLRRALAEPGYSAGAAIVQVLVLLDEVIVDAEPLTAHLARLDAATTQPLWDSGHISMGMDILDYVDDVRRHPPRAADAPLIAASRSAIPRALGLFADIAEAAATAELSPETLRRLAERIDTYDRNDIDEGTGTSTV